MVRQRLETTNHTNVAVRCNETLPNDRAALGRKSLALGPCVVTGHQGTDGQQGGPKLCP